jgi:triacylglycerol lipase
LSRRRRIMFAGVAALILAAGVLVAARVLGASAPAGTPAQDRLGPVVLVPGYGGSQDALRSLAGRITGRETRLVTLPGNGTGDLLAQVSALEQVVGDAPSVDVIGYSAGGVVARLWVARGGSHRARRVITLGSPLHGTRLAATGGVVVPDACPVACQQLAPGSALLTSVAREPVPIPWLSIWTRDDQTVLPPDSARLDGAVNLELQDLCPTVHIEHSELPTNALSTAVVQHALSTDPLTVATLGVSCP